MSKLSLKQSKEVKRSPAASTKTSTPKRSENNSSIDNLNVDDSPILCYNSTADENLEVVWNWHSPSSRPRRFVPKKPRNLVTLPTVTNLLLPIRNDKPDFEKICRDLEKLQREIGLNRDNATSSSNSDSCLLISLNEEDPLPQHQQTNNNNNNKDADFDEFLQDDTIEKEMIIASQVAEQVVFKAPKPLVDEPLVPDDSFDKDLEMMHDEDIVHLTQAVNGTNRTSPNLFRESEAARSRTDFGMDDGLPAHFSGFRIEPNDRQKFNFRGSSASDMDRKRSEALARLEVRNANPTSNGSREDSNFVPKVPSLGNYYDPMCRPHQKPFAPRSNGSTFPDAEVERMRLEALAKLERKRQADVPCRNLAMYGKRNVPEITPDVEKEIEKKRLEALAKLEAKKICNLPSNANTNFDDADIEKKRLLALERIKQVPKTVYQNPNLIHPPTSSSSSNFNYSTENNIESIEQEIKRKRLQALAKLEAKNKLNIAPKVPKDVPLQSNVEKEIERKRLEALAKLEAKKKRALPNFQEPSISPIKCSPDEIEKKRLEAVAKLEAKKKFNFLDKNVQINHVPAGNAPLDETSPMKCSPEQIEQKRLEALKRLEVKKQLFSDTLSVPSSGTSLLRHRSTDFSTNASASAQNSRILNSATKQKSWNEQMDERMEKNRLEALRRLQLNKQKKRNVP